MFKVIGEPLREVNGNEVAFEIFTGLEEELFVSGPQCNEIIGSCKGGELMVLRGVAEDDCYSAKYPKTRVVRERVFWYFDRLERRH